MNFSGQLSSSMIPGKSKLKQVSFSKLLKTAFELSLGFEEMSCDSS